MSEELRPAKCKADVAAWLAERLAKLPPRDLSTSEGRRLRRIDRRRLACGLRREARKLLREEQARARGTT